MIIGFVGRAGSGKNTAAERLAMIVDREVEFVAFADKLKESVAAIFNFNPKALDMFKNTSASVTLDFAGTYEISLSLREFLQRYGTEGHREVFGTDFWVDQALDRDPINDGYDEPLMLVTDVRFDNEIFGIKDRGGYVVEIKGANDPEITEETHASELPLDGSDSVIDNSVLDDDFAHLDSQLYDLATKLGLPLREAA